MEEWEEGRSYRGGAERWGEGKLQERCEGEELQERWAGRQEGEEDEVGRSHWGVREGGRVGLVRLGLGMLGLRRAQTIMVAEHLIHNFFLLYLLTTKIKLI